MTLTDPARSSAAAAPPPPAPRRRMTLRTLAAVVRNPLDALPPAIFHEPVVRLRAGGIERIYLADPQLIQEALVGHAEALGKGRDMRRVLGPALGQGLLTAEGAHWRWQRRSTAGAFTPARLQALAPAMIACAQATRDRWLASGAPPTVRIGHEMMRTTFDIIGETMLSGAGAIDVARVERAVADYLQPVGWMLAYSLMRAPEWAPYPGRGRARRASTYIRAALGEVVARRRRDPGERADLVALLLAAADPESGRAMTDAEVVDNLLTFMTAGHETTALGLAWTFHLLSQHPQVEARVLAEVDAAVGDGPVTPDSLERLPYLRQVFSEAMRLYPPAPIISRQVQTPFAFGGMEAPEGAMLVIPIYAVHRHARLWEAPDRFDPDRFAPEPARARHRYAYMPFGAGPRVCIGSAFALMEATAVLAVLLQRLRLARTPGGAPTPLMRVTLRPSPDIELAVAPR